MNREIIVVLNCWNYLWKIRWFA